MKLIDLEKAREEKHGDACCNICDEPAKIYKNFAICREDGSYRYLCVRCISSFVEIMCDNY